MSAIACLYGHFPDAAGHQAPAEEDMHNLETACLQWDIAAEQGVIGVLRLIRIGLVTIDVGTARDHAEEQSLLREWADLWIGSPLAGAVIAADLQSDAMCLGSLADADRRWVGLKLSVTLPESDGRRTITASPSHAHIEANRVRFMSRGRSHLPLFYLLSEKDWRKSRQGPSFLAVMRDAAQHRFKDPRWKGLASTYRFETPLPVTNTIEPDDRAEVTRILEWHHPELHIGRDLVNDADESAPSGVLVRQWTVYDLDEADWQRARDTEAQCRTRTDVQLREFDALLGGFAEAAFHGKIATFTVTGSERIIRPILPTSWDVDISALRAWHAHGRYRSDPNDSRNPHDGEAIFVDPDNAKAWLDGIAPIAFDDPPDLALAGNFLTELQAELETAAEARRNREGTEAGQLGIPGGRNAVFAILKRPPFHLKRQDYDTLIEERSSQVFRRIGRPGDRGIVSSIIDRLVVKYVGPI